MTWLLIFLGIYLLGVVIYGMAMPRWSKADSRAALTGEVIAGALWPLWVPLVLAFWLVIGLLCFGIWLTSLSLKGPDR